MRFLLVLFWGSTFLHLCLSQNFVRCCAVNVILTGFPLPFLVEDYLWRFVLQLSRRPCDSARPRVGRAEHRGLPSETVDRRCTPSDAHARTSHPRHPQSSKDHIVVIIIDAI